MRRMTLWEKIWKSFAILATFGGVFSLTGNSIPNLWLILITLILLLLVIYWHFLEKIEKKIKNIRSYFQELRFDIKYIKEKVCLIQTKGEVKNE